ncbi:bidirectional sugar transporter SWEET4-like [Corylus avellana]|uniref:bidirectional sugar transporter SWEET4-like n=1 Tax=Corylus avellana TaxID=13451 RepID=UPI00286CB6CF|nr:bidirectional sugar transporter SWEET4-like [Corylus avellana]
MVSAEAARNVVGVIGNVISFGLFLSPVPTFYKIFKNKAVEDFSPDPYIATVLNCMFWVFYGMPFVHPDSILVVTINSVGLVLELIYLAIYYTYASKHRNGRKKVLIGLAGEVIFVAIIVAITMLTLHTHTKRSLMVGVICDIFNIMMYCSPLTIMKKVITTKSVKYMPFYLSLTNFLNGCIWTAYALIKFDVYILVSNGIGAVSGLVQLILYGIYYRTTPKDDDVKASEVQMSGTNAASSRV